MKLKTWMLAGVCGAALIGCGNYVLPERNAEDATRLAEEQPHPDAVEVLDELNSLIESENRRRQSDGDDTISQDQAIFAIISTVQADRASAAAAETNFFENILQGVDAGVEVPPQPPQALNAAARAVNIARANTDAANAAREAARAAELARLNAANRARQEQLTFRFADSLPVVAPGTEGPPNAIPGQCYAQIQQPARFEIVSEQILDQPATERLEVVPATYRTEMRPVVIEEAFTRIEVVPPTYETVVEEVVVEPERQVTITVPAQFRTVVEEVPVRPPFRSWEPSDRIFPVGTSLNGGTVLGSRVTPTGTVESLIQFPATFETVSRQELVSEETTRVETVAPITETRVVRKIKTPARTREVVVPAVVEMVETQIVVTQERVERIPVPPTFRTVERNTEAQPARLVWAPVICDVDQTAELITRVQQGLAERGLYAGRIDGVNGPRTQAGINQFQLEQLDLDSATLTIDAARRLGAIR
ncbi:MAG: peptidoglycan-binding protein [Pseudomonadota bacterium]